MALDKVKEEAETEYDSVAIELICTDFLGHNGVPVTLKKLFLQTLAKHGGDEPAAVESIIEEFEEAFPDWTMHARGPVEV